MRIQTKITIEQLNQKLANSTTRNDLHFYFFFKTFGKIRIKTTA